MKYMIIIPDGMADLPMDQLEGKTPLEYARTPFMDSLASAGETGLVRTIPRGMPPGSDVANLSVMGYDPASCHTGRSPLEAISMGLDLAPDDMVFRCNLVTLSGEPEYRAKTMLDHSAGGILSEDGKILIDYIRTGLESGGISFYPGVSYRNIMVWRGGPGDMKLTPPHDILEKRIAPHLPSGSGSHTILELMEESASMLGCHPLNRSRMDTGLRPANSIWLWGQGKRPFLDDLYGKYGVRGSVISAVDLIRGIGKCAGLDVLEVEGITGTINTNMAGKAKAAVDELLSGKDFVFVHIEAPDECSHQGEAGEKIRAIELIDEKVVGYARKSLDKSGLDYRLMVLSDHPTPISIRTHTPDPVPFVIYDSRTAGRGRPKKTGFSERYASSTGIMIEKGHKLADRFFEKDPTF
jgi:2,3-bisphosphoglycerate-independent phosphoglycerate mutase